MNDSHKETDYQEVQVITSDHHTTERSAQNLPLATGATMQMIGVKDLVERQKNIVSAMDKTMKLGTHYGPAYKGNDKKVLLKPGAELLGVLFQLSPSYKIETTNYQDGHREHTIICSLHYIPTGAFIAEGLGSCSSREKKFRYRNVDEATDVSIPKSAWDKKNAGDYGGYMKEMENALADAGVEVPSDAKVGATKDDEKGWVVSLKMKGENPDIADEFNTILKIAKKRAHIDAILNATGASELFTQDVDEFDDYDANSQNKGNFGRSQQKQGSNFNSNQRTQTGSRSNTPTQGRPGQQTRQPAQRPNQERQQPQDVDSDIPLQVMQTTGGVQLWNLAKELPQDRQDQIHKLLRSGASERTVSQMTQVATMFKQCQDLIAKISKIDPEEGKGWRQALDATESSGEIKTILHGLQEYVLNAGL